MEPLSPEVLEDLRARPRDRASAKSPCARAVRIWRPRIARKFLAVLAGDADEMVLRARAGRHSLAARGILCGSHEARDRPSRRFSLTPAKHLADKPGVCDAMVQNKNCPAEYLDSRRAPSFVASASSADGRTRSRQRIPGAGVCARTFLVDHRGPKASAPRTSRLRRWTKRRSPKQLPQPSPTSPSGRRCIQRLAKMTVAQRVQFAIKGGSEARRTLIRDNNKVVQRAVLQSPRLTDQEVEAFAAMSSLTDEILRLIANNREFPQELHRRPQSHSTIPKRRWTSPCTCFRCSTPWTSSA